MSNSEKILLTRDEGLRVLGDQELDLENTLLIVKGAIASEQCHLAREYVNDFVSHREPNEGSNGGKGNWYYLAQRDQEVHFYNCTFNALSSLGVPSFEEVFSKMFVFHESANRLGLHSLQAKQYHCAFNPLVFFYPAGSGRFQWHLHDKTHQRYQVIANLTRPGVDYRGGETIIQMRDQSQVELGADFEEGDIAVFPYDLWHRVNAVESVGAASTLGRMTAILPFVPEEGLKTFYNFQT